MRKSNLFKTFVALTVMLLLAALPANAATYSASIKAVAAGAPDAGLVCASTSQSDAGGYSAVSSAGPQSQTAYWSTSFTFYLYAQAQGDAIFKGWYDNASCSGSAKSTASPYKASVSGTKNNSNPTPATYYALFVYHYFAKASVEAVGEGGSVSVNGAGATASLESGDMTTLDGASFNVTLSAQLADDDHYFAGWFSDAECTNLISSDFVCTQTVTSSATNAAAAPETRYYAKFGVVDRSDYSFTLVANPAHFSSIAGGKGDLAELDFSLDGAANVTNAAPYFTLQLTPAGDVIYTVKLYDGDDLVAVYGDDATSSSVYEIPAENLNGARVVVESREGWFLTVKGNNVTAITGNGEPLSYSAEGTRHEFNFSGDYEVQVTVENDEVLTTLRFYNAAGEMVEMPFQNQRGSTTYSHTISADLIKNGRIEANSIALGEGVPYFYMKGNPDHFTSMKLGLGTSATSADYSIELRCSAQGEINLFPEIPAGQKCYLNLVPASGVEYIMTFNYPDGTISFTNPVNRTDVYKNEFYPKPTNFNGGVVDIVSAVPLDASTEWSFTIIADPDAIQALQDNANGKAAIERSLDGVMYKPAGAHAHIMLKPTVSGKAFNAYFYQAGADITDPDAALFVTENISAKNDYSFYSTTLNRQILNALGNGGTLVIKELVGVGTGTVTINIEGNASNLVVTNGSDSSISGLKVGANTVSLNAAMLSFTHKTNGMHLASVICNGTPLKERNSEGKFSYTNKFAADGDVYDIVTDYDTSIKHNVYVEVNEGCEAFITEVTVEGKKITWTPGQPFEVSDGQTVRVQGDKLNYLVNAVTINGEPQFVNNSASTQVLEDTHIVFDVIYVNRDKSFTFEIGSDAKGSIKTAIGSYTDYSKTSTVSFCDADNPIEFIAETTATGQTERAPLWKINGENYMIASSFKYEVKQDDVIRIDYTTDKIYNVTFKLPEGLLEAPSITVNGEAKEPGLYVLKAKDVIVISTTDHIKVTGVTIASEAVNPNAAGAYEITVADADLYIEIEAGINRSSALNVYVDGLDGMSQCSLTDKDGDAIATLAEGRNEVHFAAWLDLPLTLICDLADEEGVLEISLDNEAVGGEDGVYALECANGQSLYITVKESEVYETTTVNAEGFGTFASHNDVVFADAEGSTVRAFIAVSFDEETKGVKFVPVTGIIPAGTGILIQSTFARDLEIPVAVDGPALAPVMRAEGEESDPVYTFDDNLLVPAYKYATIPAADEQYDRYIYSTVDGQSEFRLVTEPVECDSNQAYLLLPKSAVAHPDSLGNLTSTEDGTLTSIENVTVNAEAPQGVYNIHGIKVADSLSDKTLAPGLYIIKGQKVVITK